MCKPNNHDDNVSPIATGGEGPPVHVVVAGAGPSGLLTVINMLRRNKNNNNKYRVTIIDVGPDHGTFTSDDLKRHRSWMIGLSAHGLTALKRVPDLYEEYVQKVGILTETIHLHVGGREITVNANDFGNSYVVDRNYICAALARYIHEHYADDNVALRRMYDTKILYVDGDNKRVLTRASRDPSAEESYVDYDVLLGCDGVRSVVRECILKNHRDFECTVDGIFNDFKAVHIDRPKGVKNGAVHVLPNCVKNANGIALPELGDKLNLAIGFPSNAETDKELHSSEKDVVKRYFETRFEAFELDDYDDFARQWVDQNWSTSGQVHCNFYHSTKLSCLILGDAAHATSPSIGQGMNTALADSAALDEMLDRRRDDWNLVLPEFSNERVKEGNALTYLSYYAYSSSPSQALYMQVTGLIRIVVNRWLPSFVEADPMTEIPKGGKLSVAYDRMVRLGRLPAVRKVNDAARLRHFERTTGMVVATDDDGSSSSSSLLLSWRNLIVLPVLGVGLAYFRGVFA